MDMHFRRISKNVSASLSVHIDDASLAQFVTETLYCEPASLNPASLHQDSCFCWLLGFIFHHRL